MRGLVDSFESLCKNIESVLDYVVYSIFGDMFNEEE
tara:strand:+ start:443 stop:550 length:108 start_codon:yes stop_codon:yes gene_type:complete